MKKPTKEAVDQLLDWARAWVQNETCIEETPADKLTDAEKAALVILDLWMEGKN